MGASLKKPISGSDYSLKKEYEGGIASNRESSHRGEYLPALVHTARGPAKIGVAGRKFLKEKKSNKNLWK